MTAVHRPGGDRVVEYPAVIQHPDTGRKYLFISDLHVKKFVELTAAESEVLLAYLGAVAVRPEFTCRYRWASGTVNLWDNRCTQHYAVNDFTEKRLAHRVTAHVSVPPQGAAGRWPRDPVTNLKWQPGSATGYQFNQ